MSAQYSFLDLIDTCDNFRLSSTSDSERLIPWHINPSSSSSVIGLLIPPIVKKLREENERSRALGKDCLWELTTREEGGEPVRVCFASHIRTPAERTAVMKELCERWRDEGFCENVVGPRQWRGEMYPVYHQPFGAMYVKGDHENEVSGEENYAFEMERAACALFGVVTYGVHMTVYQEDADGVKVWVPTRAKTKQTWPGYLDNSVAGGIPSGMSAFESLVKESMEEASIAEWVVRKDAKSAGAVSYFFRTGKGWLQPEVEYIYDLKIPTDPSIDPTPFQPKPLDGEVERFELLSLNEAISRMRAGLFKPNTALVLLDFMIRHSYLTPENQPNYLEILTRLHGRFEYEKWRESGALA